MVIMKILSVLIVGLSWCSQICGGLPTVDPGLFVISGVESCGGGKGYCLLGLDCTLDEDFRPDDNRGHCDGLRSAFTPSAHFVCCQDSGREGGGKRPGRPGLPLDVEDDLTTASIHTGPDSSENEISDELDQTFEHDVSLTTEISMEESTDLPVTDEVDSRTTPPDVEDIKPTDSEDGNGETITENKVENNCWKESACNGTVRFMFQGQRLCLGTMVNHQWAVTSANCALRVFRTGMVNVWGHLLSDPNSSDSIKTIVVHENYRPASDNLLMPEVNNIGMVMLKAGLPNVDKCAPCLPTSENEFAGLKCATLRKPMISTAEQLRLENHKNEAELCISKVETMQVGGATQFYTMACGNSWEARYIGEREDWGNPLFCGRTLAGVETTSGVGMSVFTPINRFSEWISKNLHPAPQQYFRLH